MEALSFDITEVDRWNFWQSWAVVIQTGTSVGRRPGWVPNPSRPRSTFFVNWRDWLNRQTEDWVRLLTRTDSDRVGMVSVVLCRHPADAETVLRAWGVRSSVALQFPSVEIDFGLRTGSWSGHPLHRPSEARSFGQMGLQPPRKPDWCQCPPHWMERKSNVTRGSILGPKLLDYVDKFGSIRLFLVERLWLKSTQSVFLFVL